MKGDHETEKDPDGIGSTVDRKFHYYEQQLQRRIQHYYISDVVESPDEYVEMIHRIHTSSPEDVIHIHLNTPGGRLDTGVQIINAMKCSRAPVICSLEAEAYSLGTLIFLAADEWQVHDNCMMMFHNYSGGIWGKGNEQAAQLEATVKWFGELARDIYTPFLSIGEVERMLKGEDLWFHTGEIRKRLNRMVKNLDKERRAENANAKKTIRKPKVSDE
jgi:ATP-dependent protease ClpP protease subunit